MKLTKVPKEACQQSIILKVNEEETDDWGKHGTADVTINNCVVQLGTVYSGSNNDRQVVANGIIFLYAGITTPLPTMSKDMLGSAVEYQGKEYTIKTINENLEPFSKKLWSYELEIM